MFSVGTNDKLLNDMKDDVLPEVETDKNTPTFRDDTAFLKRKHSLSQTDSPSP
jgi:hypothetical protein